ncbi:hypothetical protein DFH27DRAFT_316679 [Peziza echinospora]|nr:hypothetical protein DFH27DRAFT_316679 [Peziza echinospora]
MVVSEPPPLAVRLPSINRLSKLQRDEMTKGERTVYVAITSPQDKKGNDFEALYEYVHHYVQAEKIESIVTMARRYYLITTNDMGYVNELIMHMNGAKFTLDNRTIRVEASQYGRPNNSLPKASWIIATPPLTIAANLREGIRAAITNGKVPPLRIRKVLRNSIADGRSYSY